MVPWLVTVASCLVILGFYIVKSQYPVDKRKDTHEVEVKEENGKEEQKEEQKKEEEEEDKNQDNETDGEETEDEDENENGDEFIQQHKEDPTVLLVDPEFEVKFERKIGGGSFGVVFSVDVDVSSVHSPSSSSSASSVRARMVTMAYKHFNISNRKSQPSLQKEVLLLKNLKHPNIVHLYGYCMNEPR